MGGIGGLGDMIGKVIRGFFGLFGLELPSWGMPALGLVVLVLMFPRMLSNVKIQQARSALSRSRVVAAAEREGLEERAFSLVAERPEQLYSLAEEALRLNRLGLARRCASRLGQLEFDKKRLGKLEQAINPPVELPPNPLALGVVVDQLIENGLHAEAKRRLDAGERRWPGAPELEGPRTRLSGLV
jgi:hypothetical protein